jgi:hypothetical protein
MKTRFIEIQKFTQWWVWLIMLAILIFPVYAYWSGGLSEAIKASPIALVFILFFILKLTIEIDDKGIRMSYFPLVNKFTEWSEINTVSVINYGFVGGWGIRFWTKHGTVYNVTGNKGLLVELKSGKTFVIGTQKEEELKAALKELGKIE